LSDEVVQQEDRQRQRERRVRDPYRQVGAAQAETRKDRDGAEVDAAGEAALGVPAEGARGEFATDEEVRAVWAKYGL